MRKKDIVLCVLEIVIANIIMYVVFFKLQYNQDVYLQLNPHPLFILCIFIAVRYGNYLAVVCAIISTLFYCFVFYQVNHSFILIFQKFRDFKYILIFFWTAIVLGFFKDNKDAEIERLNSEKNLVKENYAKLEKSYNLNQKLLNELKKQIVNSEESILNLYEIASRLGNLDAEEIFTETLGILSKYLKADTVSIYTLDEKSGYLRLKIRLGSLSTVNRSLLVKNSAGFTKVSLDKQVVRWSDIKEEGFPLMSAPIMRDGNVLAIVNIEHMDYDRISEYAFQLFRLIIDWVNKSLNHAYYVDKLSKSKYFSGTRIMTYPSFLERQKSEERRRIEFSMEYSVLKFRAKNLNINFLSDKLNRVVRAVDILGYDPISNYILILLPATPKEMALIAEERIIKQLNSNLEKIRDNDKPRT